MTSPGPQLVELSSSMSRVAAALRRTLRSLYHVHPGRDDDAMAITAELLADAVDGAGTLGLGQD
ncbi:MAG: hypothetical protein F2545_04445, partial [Actinobacteria bacterium]|nr:hypothetical protein [Actinomycetota bacterium]